MLEGQTGPPENIADDGSSSIFNNKTRLLIVGFVLALALGYLVYTAFPGNTLYFLTVDEFLADEANLDGRSVRVEGRLVPESFQRVDGSTLANFEMMQNGAVMKATYNGVFPDLFFNPHSSIILQGSYGDGGVFQTESVVVKCPSKFQALEDVV